MNPPALLLFFCFPQTVVTYQVPLSAAGVDAYSSVCEQASSQQVGDALLSGPGDAACQVATVAAGVSN